ncbi:MAG TPA: hypothetical protein VMS18_07455 [Candidatus Binatia bacterium]|nr:hypothetical protein [Candidatus Binatia bacterium]
MRSAKLVQLMKSNSVTMSEELVAKIRSSGKCADLLLRVPESEQKQYALGIFLDLTKWLANETDSILEGHYVGLGLHRASQGVPVSQVFSAAAVAREYLWDYTQQECLHEEPVEFWGGVMLLRSLDTFFDRVLYFTLCGYEKAGGGESAVLSSFSQRRPA